MSVPAVAEPANQAGSPEAPSTGQGAGVFPAQEQRAGLTPVSGAEAPEQEPKDRTDYFRQAFNQIRGYTQAAAPAPSQVSEQPAKDPRTSQAPPATSGPVPERERPVTQTPAGPATTLPPAPQVQQQPPPPQTQQISLSPEELQRRVQAEADRVIAKQQRDAQAQAERDREVELRRTNPFEYARHMENREAELESSQQETKRLTDVVSQQLFQYDRNVLDIFVSALPEKHREKVIAKEEGIPGRKQTAAATLQALRQLWTAEGRASAKADLMKDQTFVKEVLARYSSQTPEPESSPAQARPSNGASQVGAEDGHAAVNAFIRFGAQSARVTSGR